MEWKDPLLELPKVKEGKSYVQCLTMCSVCGSKDPIFLGMMFYPKIGWEIINMGIELPVKEILFLVESWVYFDEIPVFKEVLTKREKGDKTFGRFAQYMPGGIFSFNV